MGRRPDYWRAYYATNREQRLANQRASYRRHKAERLAARAAKRGALTDDERARASEYFREYYTSHVAEYRDRDRVFRLRHYGIDEASFFRLLEFQGGGCGICGKRPAARRRFDIDHDHRSGAVRGVLCNPCNQRLGKFRDDADRLEARGHIAAACYLRTPPGTVADLGGSERGTRSA